MEILYTLNFSNSCVIRVLWAKGQAVASGLLAGECGSSSCGGSLRCWRGGSGTCWPGSSKVRHPFSLLIAVVHTFRIYR